MSDYFLVLASYLSRQNCKMCYAQTRDNASLARSLYENTLVLFVVVFSQKSPCLTDNNL